MVNFRLWLTENEGEKKLIIMRGLPGSGKSTLAQQLGQSGVVLSTDDFFMSQGQYKFDSTLLGKNHQANINSTKEAMKHGVSPIVVDNTNVTAIEIRPYVLMARQYGYQVEFREPETSWKFDPEKLAKINSHGVPKDAIERMLSRWQPNLKPEDIT